MSKILTQEEATEIVSSMLEPFGFNPVTLKYDGSLESSRQYSIGNSHKGLRRVGYLWWKKEVEVISYESIFEGWCWEQAIEKLDKWITKDVLPRVELADKFREKQATYLLHKKIEQ